MSSIPNPVTRPPATGDTSGFAQSTEAVRQTLHQHLRKTASFIKIEEIVAPAGKTLAEARGYAVADYQDFLEKKWIDDLRKEYEVKINDDTLKAMVKK